MREHSFKLLPEQRLLGACAAAALLWKERTAFFRDVKHWSQILLIVGLVFVYLFSIRRLPLDSAELRSLVSFLNVGTAGFVLAALGLRFTFPAISLEGRSWWVLRSAPIGIAGIMRAKLVFSMIPILGIASTLAVMTNWILEADRFTSWLSFGALVTVGAVICVMGVGFGALFPNFLVENIHQIESSVGGFVYMAACLFYVGLTIAVLAAPMQMHFAERFGTGLWNSRVALYSGAGWLALNAVALILPWQLGRRALENHE